MKITTTFITALAAGLLTHVAGASADTVYWDGTGTSWNVATNWSTSSTADTPDPAAYPTAADDAIFNIDSVTANQTINLNADQAVHSLTFNSTGSSQFNSGGATRNLVIGNGGITMASGAGSATLGSSSQTILVKMSDSQTWTNNSSGSLTIRNSFGGLASNIAATLTLASTGAGSINFQGTLEQGAGTLSLVVDMQGSGKLTHLGNFNHTGGTTLLSGTIQSRPATYAFGQGELLMGDTSGSASTQLNFDRSGSYGGGPITVRSGSTGTHTFYALTDSAAVITADVVLQSELTTQTQNGGASISFANPVSGSAGIHHIGSGMIELQAANTYTGDTFIDAGSFHLADTGSMLFAVTDATSNRLYGDNAATIANLDGAFKLDLSAVTVDSGVWTLIDVATLNETFGATFAVADNSGLLSFSQSGGVWTSSDQHWSFSQATGQLTLTAVVPEPATFSLLALGGLMIVRRSL